MRKCFHVFFLQRFFAYIRHVVFLCCAFFYYCVFVIIMPNDHEKMFPSFLGGMHFAFFAYIRHVVLQRFFAYIRNVEVCMFCM